MPLHHGIYVPPKRPQPPMRDPWIELTQLILMGMGVWFLASQFVNFLRWLSP